MKRAPKTPAHQGTVINNSTFTSGQMSDNTRAVAEILARAALANAEAISHIAKGFEGAPGLVVYGSK